MGLKSALGALFSFEKASENVLDKDNGLAVRAGGWIDGLSYTAQEKAEMTLEFAKVGAERLKQLEPFKVVQRILAFATMFFWIFVGMNVVVAIWIDSLYGTAVAPQMLEFAFSDYVFWPVVTIFSLYFGGGLVNSIRGDKRK